MNARNVAVSHALLFLFPHGFSKNLGAILVLVLRLNWCVYVVDSSAKFGYLCAQKLEGVYLFLIFHKCIFIRVSESWILGSYRDLILLILQKSVVRCYLLSILTFNVLIYLTLFLIHSYSMTNLSFCFLNLLQDPVSISVLPIH